MKWTVLLVYALAVLAFSEIIEIPEELQQTCDECGDCPEQGENICMCFKKLIFQGANLRRIYQVLSDTSGINIVLDPDIDIKVTLWIENMSWCQLFKLPLKLYDLRAIKEDGYIRIVTKEEYWNSRFTEMDKLSKEEQFMDTETRILRVENVTVANIQPIIQSALSSRGGIVIDPGSNKLIITELPENFAAIEALVESVDVLGKQIKITCEIVQIDQSALEELGVKWDVIDIHPTSNDDVALYSSMDQVGGAPGGGVGHLTWGGTISDLAIFSFQLSAIISAGKAKVIDQPYIITADNVIGEIFSGKQIPINTVDQAGNLITTFYQVGTKVSVTPHIAADNKVKLKLMIERSGYTLGAAGYEITTRNLNTEMTVRSGDAVVIGGLITEELQENEHGIPLLKDIPWIGSIFRYSSESANTSVITIFITPEVLPE